jgi:diguanylate cyclase (GGDEF)-like protein
MITVKRHNYLLFSYWYPSLCIVIWIILSCLYIFSHNQNVSKSFQHDMQNKTHHIKKTLHTLHSSAEYLKLTHSNNSTVNTHDFSLISNNMISNHPSLKYISWSPLIRHIERPLIESIIAQPFYTLLDHDHDTSTIPIKKRLNNHSYYLPIIAIAPQASQSNFLGYDLYTPKYTQQLNLNTSASDSPMRTLAEPPAFTSPSLSLMSIMIPIVNDNSPKITGIITVIISLETLLLQQPFHNTHHQAHIEFKNLTQHNQYKPISSALFSNKSFSKTEYQYITTLDVFDQTWSMRAYPTKDYLLSKLSLLHLINFIFSLIVIIVYFYLVKTYQRKYSTIKRLVHKRTQQLKKNNHKLRESNKSLEYLSLLDPLTNLGNRRLFDITLNKEWKRSLRSKQPITIVMIDVDHFKKYNDSLGHIQGDVCLQKVSMALKSVFSRSSDVITRYGGEEFAVILPYSGPEALTAAENFIHAVKWLSIPHPSSPTSNYVTISIGVCSATNISQQDNSTDLVTQADNALYEAKHLGRNQVVYKNFDTSTTTNS